MAAKKSQTVWRQIKGRDVEKVFYLLHFFSDARIFGKDRAVRCLFEPLVKSVGKARGVIPGHVFAVRVL